MNPFKRVANPHVGKIGDTILMEPACDAYALANDCQIHLECDGRHAALFKGHPRVIPVAPGAPALADFTLDTGKAFHWSHEHRLPHGAGFFHQFGMDIQKGQRLHYRNFFSESVARFKDAILIVPFAHSCTSRDSTTGALKPGARANLQPPMEWWEPIQRWTSTTPWDTFILCGNDTGWDWDHEWTGACVVRGLSFDETVVAMTFAKLLISVNTGLLHIASGTKTPTVYVCSGTPPNFSCPDTRVAIVTGETADQIDAQAVVAAAKRLTY